MSDLCVCIHKQVRVGGAAWGHAPPENVLEIRCSEIVFEVILGQKQSRSSYMVHRVFHPIFGFPCMHLLSQLTSNFHERRY